jgi:steroid delta-isomerase-like uncharacterized protein
MTIAENKKLVRRHYNEVLTGKKLDVIDEIYADPLQIGDAGSMPREQFKQVAGLTHIAFPDLEVTIKDQIAEAERVVTRFEAKGTQRGEFMGLPPTGKVVTIKAIHIHAIKEGRIAALWEEIDLAGLYQQLGVGK